MVWLWLGATAAPAEESLLMGGSTPPHTFFLGAWRGWQALDGHAGSGSLCD